MGNNKNSGFFKGLGLGAVMSVLSLSLLSGCGGLASLVGPGSDAGNVADKIEQSTTKTNAESGGQSSDNGKSNYGNYTPMSEILTDDVIAKIDTLMQVVDYYYLYDYDKQEMENRLYKAVFEALGDPYSVYYTKEEYDTFMESSSGTYCGIGVVVQQNMETGIVTAVRPYTNCPGYEAGIRPEDIILAVDGTQITGMDLNAAVAMIRGEEGTEVTITLQREKEIFDVVVTRRQIDVETVTYRMMEDDIGYIQVDEFDEVTAKQFSAALDDLISQGMKGLVVDIRNNPGGLLNIVVEMLDEILPEGTIVSVKDKAGKTDEYTSDANTKLNVPMAVVVNGNSASASEIFAGAVQDYGVGTIVGNTTFGKGIVQTIFSLKDGTGVKITIEDYYTPSGRSIHKLGVTPDVEVELPDELKVLVNVPEDEDTQLKKAIEIIKEQMK